MASDLEIEIFGYSIFHKTWFQMGMVKSKPIIFHTYGAECYRIENIYEIIDDMFMEPISCRRKLFKGIYLENFTEEKVESFNSLSECNEYVTRICNRDDLFGDLTVFEKIFATCAFVLDFCIYIHRYNSIDVIEYGHLFWTMYFNKFTEKFYGSGGWSKLKIVAKTYTDLDDFFSWFKDGSLSEIKEAVDNYISFTNSDQYDEYTSKQERNTVSKVWIKFCKERFENCVQFPPIDTYPFMAFEIEDLLVDLKNIFENCLEGSVYSMGIECIETINENAANKNINEDVGIHHSPKRNSEILNILEDLCINQIHENSCYKKISPYSVPNPAIVCSENEGASPNEEVNSDKTMKTNSSTKNRDGRKKVDSKTGNITKSHMLEYECNGKTSAYISSENN